MTNQRAVKVLSYLYRIVEAGEKGYAAVAANVKNRGLKVLFKSFAQQRAKYKSELFEEIQRLGGQSRPRGSIRGAIHRGRIEIYAAMIIESDNKEKMVIKEVLVGEKVAVRTYEKTLKTDLPPETREIVARQFEEVRQVVDQIKLMQGKDGKRLIVRLFDSEKDAEKAVQVLEEADLHPEMLGRIALRDIELYEGSRTTTRETILSGAVGGGLWGSAIGALAGIGVVKAPGMEALGQATIQSIWALVALAGILGGALVGAIIGLFIGSGISGEDTYLYDHSIQHGQIVLKMLVDQARAPEAGRILAQVNIESRAHTGEALA
jgi:uncharacterized protein (TIGR02284 family)